MAKTIGEKSLTDGSLTLYKLYQILSERCHNAYFSSLLDDVNKVHFSIPTGGLDEGQIKDVLIIQQLFCPNTNMMQKSLAINISLLLGRKSNGKYV